MFIQFNLLLFVFCLLVLFTFHVSFFIYISCQLLSQLCRRFLCNKIKRHFVAVIHYANLLHMLYFDLRPGPKILFQGDTPEGSETFQWPVIERDRVSGLRLMIWDKVKVPLCHYSDAPEESNL